MLKKTILISVLALNVATSASALPLQAELRLEGLKSRCPECEQVARFMAEQIDQHCNQEITEDYLIDMEGTPTYNYFLDIFTYDASLFPKVTRVAKDNMDCDLSKWDEKTIAALQAETQGYPTNKLK